MEKEELIDNLVDSIDYLIDAKIQVNAGKDRWKDVYQARADIREIVAVLLDVELK